MWLTFDSCLWLCVASFLYVFLWEIPFFIKAYVIQLFEFQEQVILPVYDQYNKLLSVAFIQWPPALLSTPIFFKEIF